MSDDFGGLPLALGPALPRSVGELRRRLIDCRDRLSTHMVDDALTFACLLDKLSDEELAELLRR